MNAPLPHPAARRPASFKPVIPSPQSPEFAALVDERVSLIERACLVADVVEVLGALPDPADMTVICSAYRAGCPDIALGPVLPRILDREWRQLADSEITAELNKRASGLVADDWIPGYVTAREIAIAQMEVKHEGMSRRDYFAAQALIGWMASSEPHRDLTRKADEMARACFLIADAMLEASEEADA